MNPVDAMDKAMARLHAKMRAISWSSRANQAHHLEQMALLRNEDGRAHATWKDICQMRLAHWEAVQHG